VGGDIEYYSMYFAKLVGRNGVVHVFKPNHSYVKRIKLIIEINDELLTPLTVNELVLADIRGTKAFHFSSNIEDQTSSGSYIQNIYKPLDYKVYNRSNFTLGKAKVITLDEYVRDMALYNIGVIKIDTKGVEHRVTKGVQASVRALKPIIIDRGSFDVCNATYL
jgi:FkbM family methyltransferase